MTVKEAVARGYNFFVVAFLGIVGGSLVGEVPAEGPWLFKLDDVLVVVVGVVAVAWYLVGKNRYQRSAVPLALAVVAFAAKVLGIVVELKDVLEVGDDYGAVQTLFFLVIVAGVAFYLTRPAALEAAGTRAASQMPGRVGR